LNSTFYAAADWFIAVKYTILFADREPSPLHMGKHDCPSFSHLPLDAIVPVLKCEHISKRLVRQIDIFIPHMCPVLETLDHFPITLLKISLCV